MIISYAKGWAKTLDINGKTNRKEFWAFVFIDMLILLILTNYDRQVFEGTSTFLFYPGLYFLLGWITRITLLGRRIRDTGRNTIWMFWYLFPGVGWVILSLLALQPTSSKNKDAVPVKVVENEKGENSYKKPNEESLQSKLEELKTLKKEGLVSEEEYEKIRKNTLGL